MTIKPEFLDDTYAHDITLLPLRGKRPSAKNWPMRTFHRSLVKEAVRRGHNYGVRLSDTLMAIDVDHRAFPRGETMESDNPFKRLCDDVKIDVEDYPVHRTGSGGLHVFMTKPAEVNLSTKLANYPGIEIKSGSGSQVVAAGSIHPKTGKPYCWDSLSDLSELPPQAPQKLLEIATTRMPTKSAAAQAMLDHEQFEDLLETIEPGDFPDNESWLPLAMSLHDVTGGDPYCGELFDIWCQGGSGYESDVLSRWRSFDTGKRSRNSIGTLRRILKGNSKALGLISDRNSAADDFDDDLQSAPDHNDWSAIAETFLKGQARTLRDARAWLIYNPNSNRYEAQDDERFQAAVRSHLRDLTVIKSGTEIRMRPNRATVGETLAALEAACQAPSDLPCWLEGDGEDVRDILPMKNGLLNLRTGELLAPTDRLGTRNSAQVDYDPLATCPRWERFVREVFSDDGAGDDCDTAAISALQESMGYLLTQDTSLQKIFLMVSRPRGGKGTIQRVLTALIGEESVTSPTSDSLKGDFGLWPFIGRQLALIGDARCLSDRRVVEKLLSVSGEDRLTINIKNEKQKEVRLPTRVMIATNNLPQFKDASNAIISRLIVLRLRASFVGREDRGLEKALLKELPGILNWCLEGLSKVRSRGRIDNPPSAAVDLELLNTMSSPVETFCKEQIQSAPGHVVPAAEVFEAFENWCLLADVNYTGGATYFPNDLRSVMPSVEKTRRRLNTKLTYVFVGMKLRPIET